MLLLHHSPISFLHFFRGVISPEPFVDTTSRDYRCGHILGAQSLYYLSLLLLLLLFLLLFQLFFLLLFLFLWFIFLLLLLLLYLPSSCLSIHHEQKAAFHSPAAVFLWATQMKEGERQLFFLNIWSIFSLVTFFKSYWMH